MKYFCAMLALAASLAFAAPIEQEQEVQVESRQLLGIDWFPGVPPMDAEEETADVEERGLLGIDWFPCKSLTISDSPTVVRSADGEKCSMTI